MLRTKQLTALLAAALAVAAAAAPTKEKVAAIVTFSDGATVAGELSMMGPRPLTLAPTGAKHQKSFYFRDILSLEHVPETATMEKPWTFKEMGKHEKIYFDGEYPLINFKTTIRLIDGSSVSGHIISAVLVVRGDEKSKFFFKRQIKGKLGQKLDDIVYATRIQFPEHRGAAAKRLAGRLKGFGKLLAASALDVERQQVLYARVREERFDFGNVLPGAYDVCLFTDTHVLLGLSELTPANRSGDPLRDSDLAAIKKNVALADDFFNDRWVEALTGHRRYAKALLYKRRAKYYASDSITPGGFLWHLEVWSWHMPETEWKLDKRHMLVRHKQLGGQTVRKLYLLPTLAAVPPGKELALEPPPDGKPPGRFLRDLN